MLGKVGRLGLLPHSLLNRVNSRRCCRSCNNSRKLVPPPHRPTPSLPPKGHPFWSRWQPEEKKVEAEIEGVAEREEREERE